MNRRFEGKVAIVTGGNSGIGEATAHRFARDGARVAIMARRIEEGQAVEQSIRREGGMALFLPCDVSDRHAVESAVANVIEEFGGIHLLFNNAGGAARSLFPDESDEVWQSVLDVNLTGTFFLCRAVWPHLIAGGGGAIVNMSSVAAVYGLSEAIRGPLPVTPSASYTVAKAGIEALTRYLASIGARHNIRVNCVRPGQIATDRLTGGTGEHAFKSFYDMVQLLDGPGYAEDVANAVAFLASEEARFITAEVLNVDGGTATKL